MRLTLRTLLAYLDDTLDAGQAREIGKKVSASPDAQELVDRIKRVTRKRSLATPPAGTTVTDPNTVTAYLSDTLPPDAVAAFEKQCLDSDVHLAEVAAVHQILTLLLCEQARVPPSAHRRMYGLVTGRESVPGRKPGNVIPVGGARDTDRSADGGDDAAYLLGLSGYTRSEAPGQYAVKAVAAVLLAAIAGVAGFLAWPTATGSRSPGDFARTTAPTGMVERQDEPAPTTAPTASAAQEPDPKPPEKAPEPAPAPAVAVKEPEPQPPTPVTQPAPVAPAPAPFDPPANPAGAVAPAPSAERVALGQPAKPTKAGPGGVLVRRSPGADGFTRVLPADTVYGGERLMSLPGYKSSVRLDAGVVLDLWGNLPDLLPTPVPLFEAAATVTAPPPGFAADIAVHAGRVYVKSTLPGGATVRLRAGGRVWDLKLKDNKSEVAVEVANTLTPAGDANPTRAAGGLFVVTGSATLTSLSPEPAAAKELAAGAAVYFDSRTPGEVVQPPADAGSAAGRAAMAYWSKFVTPGNATQAALILRSLEDYSAKMTDPARVRQTFDAGLPSGDEGTAQSAAAARVTLFAFAALGEVAGLANALGDADRPLLRATAAEGLRHAVAIDPGVLPKFTGALTTTGRLTEASAADAVRLLRGLSEADRTDPAAAAGIVKLLSSEALPVRELAFGLLVGAVDPKDPQARALTGFDPGAPAAERQASAAAWDKWAADLAKKAAKPADKKP